MSEASEAKASDDYQTFRSELGDLRIRVSKLENVETASRMNGEVRQLVTDTAELRECIDNLRSKISHIETVESSLLSKIADIEGRLSRGSDRVGSNNLQHDLEEAAAATAEEDDDEEVEEETLPHDTFSFMIVAPTFSTSFLLSFSVFFFQISAFSLVASSIIVPEDSNNYFSIPANVEGVVRFTQMVAIVIAVITQDDIRTGLNLFLQGYENEHISRSFPKVTRAKWMLSIIARLMEGSLGLIVTFLLIVSVETVVDLLLNFTAMAFVSQLDEVCFFMSHEGFCGKMNSCVAKLISDTKIRRTRTKRKGHIHRTMFLIFLFVMLFSGWSMVALNQNSGKYLCSTVFVQFADEFNPLLGSFSGLYDQIGLEKHFLSPRNFGFVDRRTGLAAFSYCEDLEAWTFTNLEDPASANTIDPCSNWLARSETTSTFDLTETASLTWIVRNNIQREAILEPFFLSCYECDGLFNSDGFDTRCSGRGRCEDAVCSCNDGWYGLRCEFREPCQILEFDNRFGPFQGNHEWSSVFTRFELNDEFIDTYHRPVYINEYSEGLFDIIFFMGRRWVATYSALLPNITEDAQIEKETLAAYFGENFHPLLEGFSVALASAPVDVGTFGDSTSPARLEWYALSSSSMNSEIVAEEREAGILTLLPSVLLCAVCDTVSNVCLYDGECVNGTCQCSIGSSGALCQSPPVGNGRCDLFFNTLEFEHDGGDCCESTCVSGNQYTCGRDESGFVNLGYSFCHDIVEGWHVSGESILGDGSAGSGHSVKLSGNGDVLAVSDPILDEVTLFDKVGSQWIERGRPVEGRAGINFGSSMAMSTGPPTMFSNPITMVPVIIAVTNAFHPTVYISVFDCSARSCSQVGDDLVAIEGIGPMLGVVDLSDNGEIVVAGARPVPTPEYANILYPLVVFRRDLYGGDWTRQIPDIPFRESESVYNVALSGGGDVLAVASFEAGFSPSGVLWIANSTRRVYAWQRSFWAQRGTSLVDATPHRTQLFDLQGQSMDLSFDGTFLALGLWMADDEEEGTTVRVLAWEDSESDWIQQGSPIKCGDMDLQGSSISLSSDGTIIAVAAAEYSGVDGFAAPLEDLNGEVCGFMWNGVAWELLGNPVPGGPVGSVALSADGYDLAVGLSSNGPGRSSVYNFPSNICSAGTSLLRVSLTTDDSPQSTTWTVLSNETGETLLQGGPYGSEGVFVLSFLEEICVATQDCVIFSIYDNLDLNILPEGNGINMPGGYALFLDGERLPSGNFTNAVERVYIGNCTACPVGTRLFSMLIQTCAPVAWTVVGSAGEVLFYNDSFETYFGRFDNDCSFGNQTTYWEEVCLPLDECSLFSILAPPAKELGSTGDGVTIGGVNLQYRLFIDQDEIVSNISEVIGNEPNETVASMSIGNCVR